MGGFTMTALTGAPLRDVGLPGRVLGTALHVYLGEYLSPMVGDEAPVCHLRAGSVTGTWPCLGPH